MEDYDATGLPLSTNITIWMEEQGYDINRLAVESNVSKEQIKRLLSGEAQGIPKYVLRIMRALGLGITYVETPEQGHTDD